LFLVEFELVEKHFLPGQTPHLGLSPGYGGGIGYTAFVTAHAATTTALREGETARQHRR
jgi:hypothetical protein